MEGRQNKTKFGIILALVGAGIFVLGILFFSGKLGGKGVSKASDPQGTIVIWGTLPRNTFNLALKTVMSKQNKISLVYFEVPAKDFKTKLAEAIATDSSPDMIVTDTSTLYSVRSYTQEIPYTTYPEASFKQTFSTAAYDLLQPSGILALPVAIDPIMMFYNREILAASGYSTPPATWTQLYEMAPSIISIEGGQVIRQELISFGQYKNINNAWALISTLFVQSRVPIARLDKLLGKAVNMTSSDVPGSQNAGQKVLEFFVQFSDPKSEFYTWNRSLLDSKKEFLEGRLAFFPSFASEIKDISDRNPNLNFSVSAMPQLNSDPRYQATYGNIYVAGVLKKTLNQPAAYVVLFELAGPDFQKGFAQNFMMAPALNSLLTTPPETTYLPIVYKSALISKSWYNEDMLATDQAFGQMVDNVISGKQTFQEAIFQAETILKGSAR